MESVSMMIPIYNTKVEFFKECLNSIEKQRKKFEIQLVVVDDGSINENSIEYIKLLKELEEKNSNIKVLYKKLSKNTGLGYVNNYCVHLCENEIIFRIDSDDIMHPDRLEIQYNFMIKNPDYKLCSGDFRYFRKENNIIKLETKTNHPEVLLYDNFIENYKKNRSHWFTNQSLFCMRKSAVLEVGNYNKELKYTEDIELTYKILKKYKKIYNFKEPILLLYRQHETNISNSNSNKNKFYLNKLYDILDKNI